MPRPRLTGPGFPDGLRRDDARFMALNVPATLATEIQAEGGLWWASDYYVEADRVVADVQRLEVTALRLDFRDLSLLHEMPQIRHLFIDSDGRPVLDSVTSLSRLRSLLLYCSALRGELDPLSFPDLRWLRLSLGGKGGAAVLPSIQRGHPLLEHLAVTETKARTVAELVAGFPRLCHVRVHYADHLRGLGDLAPVSDTLTGLELDMTGIRSLDGIEVLTKLEELTLIGGKVTDLSPLDALPRLQRRRIRLAGVSVGEGWGPL
jgi:hypothetical protein